MPYNWVAYFFSIFVLGTANKENSKAPTPEVKINSESDNEEVIKVI
jgi:hypothetical protein